MSKIDETVSAEELAAEQAALNSKKEEEVRTEVIEEFGFDETTDKDRIDKLVKKQMDSAEKLSKAIGQKIKYREAAKTGKTDDKGEPKTPVTPEPKADDTKGEQLSFKDQQALMKANVHEDDLDEVVNFAKFNKITVAEALKKPILVNTLAQKTEERTTAAATNTGTTRRGASTPTDDEVVSAANAGKLPTDDAGIARLIAAKAPKPRKQ